MNDRSKESREDMLERILAETAKNPYVPRKQIRPSQRSDTPQSKMAVSRENSAARQGEADSGIPVTRILTEAQKAEAAKARAAKKVEEMKRARLEREVQEERRITEVLKNENSKANKTLQDTQSLQAPAQDLQTAQAEQLSDEMQALPEEQAEQVLKASEAFENVRDVPENIAEEAEIKPVKKVKKAKKKIKKSAADDSGIWDSDSGEKVEKTAFSLNDGLAIIEWAISVAIVIVMIFTYVIRIADVDGKSMSPTLEDNDKLIVRSLFYTPQNGDVIVINNKSANLISDEGKVVECEGLEKTIVKRVIATGGQIVDIDFESGTVKVDGKVLEEKYISEATTRDEHAFEYPLNVPEGYIFVMGDNRNISMDSRHPQIGLVPEDRVVGQVIFRSYPFDKFGRIN